MADAHAKAILELKQEFRKLLADNERLSSEPTWNAAYMTALANAQLVVITHLAQYQITEPSDGR